MKIGQFFKSNISCSCYFNFECLFANKVWIKSNIINRTTYTFKRQFFHQIAFKEIVKIAHKRPESLTRIREYSYSINIEYFPVKTPSFYTSYERLQYFDQTFETDYQTRQQEYKGKQYTPVFIP